MSVVDGHSTDPSAQLVKYSLGIRDDSDAFAMLLDKYSRYHLQREFSLSSSRSAYSIRCGDPVLGVPLTEHICPLAMPSDALLAELDGCDEDVLSSVLALRQGCEAARADSGDMLCDVIDEDMLIPEEFKLQRFFQFDRHAPAAIHDASMVDRKQKFMANDVMVRELKMLTCDKINRKVYLSTETYKENVVAHVDFFTDVSASLLHWDVAPMSYKTCSILNARLTWRELLPAIRIFTELWAVASTSREATQSRNLAVSQDSVETIRMLHVMRQLGVATLVCQSPCVAEWCLADDVLAMTSTALELSTGRTPLKSMVERPLEDMTIVECAHKLKGLGFQFMAGSPSAAPKAINVESQWQKVAFVRCSGGDVTTSKEYLMVLIRLSTSPADVKAKTIHHAKSPQYYRRILDGKVPCEAAQHGPTVVMPMMDDRECIGFGLEPVGEIENQVPSQSSKRKRAPAQAGKETRLRNWVWKRLWFGQEVRIPFYYVEKKLRKSKSNPVARIVTSWQVSCPLFHTCHKKPGKVSTGCTQSRQFNGREEEEQVITCLKYWACMHADYITRTQHQKFRPHIDEIPLGAAQIEAFIPEKDLLSAPPDGQLRRKARPKTKAKPKTKACIKKTHAPVAAVLESACVHTCLTAAASDSSRSSASTSGCKDSPSSQTASSSSE